MDREAILRAAEAARTWSHQTAGRTFTLRAPSQHDVRMTYMRLGDKDGNDPAIMADLTRVLLERAVVGWSGVTENDMIANGSDDPVDYHATLVPVMLDAQDEWGKELHKQVQARMTSRNESIESAKKNSSTISTGMTQQKKTKRSG